MTFRNFINRISLVFVICCTISSFTSAQEPKPFRVDSYIPEEFTDLSLQCIGATNYSSQSYGSDFFDNGSWRTFGYKHGFVGLSATGGYRMYTERFDCSMSLGVSVDCNYNGNNSADSAIGYLDKIEYSRSDWDTWEDHIRLSLRSDLLLYPTPHFFYFCNSDMSLQTSQTLDDANIQESFRIDRFGDGTVRETTTRRLVSDYRRARSSTVNISGGIGIGRLNEGRFAATTLEMVKELKSQGLLAKTPDYAQLTAVTDMIYRYYNTAAQDSRLQRIEYMSSILRYLSDVGVIDSISSQTPYVVEDVVLYYPKYLRKFGSRMRAGVGLEWADTHDFMADDGTIRQHFVSYHEDSLNVRDSLFESTFSTHYSTFNQSVAPFVFLRGELGKPLNESWQFDGSAQITVFFSRNEKAPQEESDYFDYYQVDGSSVLTHIFSTRTTGLLQFSGLYQSFREENTASTSLYSEFINGTGTRQHYSTLTVESRLQYRISIPTELTLNVAYSLSDLRVAGTTSGGDSHRFQFGILLSHWLL